MLELLFSILNLLFAFAIFFLVIAFITGAPFVPSTTPVAKKMIEFAVIKKSETVIDLGSGDGRLLFLAAKNGAHAIGYEINPYLVILTKLRIICSPYRNSIEAHWKNFWLGKLPKADAVFIYLLPWRMDKLAEKLQKEMPKGTRIVSNSFIFPNWKIEKKDDNLHVYSYTI